MSADAPGLLYSEHPGDENFQSDADKDDTAQDIRLAGKLCAKSFTDAQTRHAEEEGDHRNLLNAIERCDLAAFEPLVERHLYGGIRRLGSKLTEEYADFFEPETVK